MIDFYSLLNLLLGRRGSVVFGVSVILSRERLLFEVFVEQIILIKKILFERSTTKLCLGIRSNLIVDLCIAEEHST